MLSQDQIDRLYKTNKEIFQKASEKYPAEVTAYKIANNLEEINFAKLDPEDCGKIIKILAFEEGVNIPIGLLNRLNNTFPGELGFLVHKSIKENLPLSNTIIQFIANNKNACVQTVNRITANSWYKMPLVIIKSAIENYGIEFCSNLIYYCLDAGVDPSESFGDEMAKEAIEMVALDHRESKMIIKNILLYEKTARNFKECYYPLFDNKVNSFLNDKSGWFYNVLYNMVKRHIPIPPFIWNQIDDDTKRTLKYEMKKSGDKINHLYDSLSESFKEFFKKRN
jgi:hypothetical protein